MVSRKKILQLRAIRVRRRIKMAAKGRLRLSIYRSKQNIYAQLIDDSRGHTIATASTLDANLRKNLSNGANRNAASAVGQLIAEKAIKSGIRNIVFDRGAYIYHGRIKALAEAAREGGLSF